jgi:hypothetical protein
MSRKKVTRRDALGLIAKTGATIGAGSAFFLSLKTSPLAGFSGDSSLEGKGTAGAQRSKTVGNVGEKVLISGSGSTLIFKISGPPGRHCGVAYAPTDVREHYRPAPGGRGVIGRDGLCTIEVNLKNLTHQKVYFRVVTGSSSDFTRDLRGTQVFQILISNGAISRFVGVHERIFEGATAAVAAAAACFKETIR